MLWNRYVIGYHGCDASLARQIVCKQKKLKPSQNDYDWLGHGIYFWEGSKARALQWAKDAAGRKGSSIKKPAVLGAVIDLGECLNLTEFENLVVVQQAYSDLQQLYQQTGQELPRNTGQNGLIRKLDCMVFETLHRLREELAPGEDKKIIPYDTVRAFFIEGETLYPGSGLRSVDHIQICVRSPHNIIGCFLP